MAENPNPKPKTKRGSLCSKSDEDTVRRYIQDAEWKFREGGKSAPPWGQIAQQLNDIGIKDTAGKNMDGPKLYELWHNTLNPAINRDPFSEEEENILIALYIEAIQDPLRRGPVTGNVLLPERDGKPLEWGRVLPGRMSNMVKNLYYHPDFIYKASTILRGQQPVGLSQERLDPVFEPSPEASSDDRALGLLDDRALASVSVDPPPGRVLAQSQFAPPPQLQFAQPPQLQSQFADPQFAPPPLGSFYVEDDFNGGKSFRKAHIKSSSNKSSRKARKSSRKSARKARKYSRKARKSSRK